MSDPESPDLERHSLDKSATRANSRASWRAVNPRIWTKKSEPQSRLENVSSLLGRISGLFSSPAFILFVGAPAGGLGTYLTFLLALDLGGWEWFGAYFIGIWMAIVVGFLGVVEKTGYAKNFESWDFPLRRVVILPIGFLLVSGTLVLFLYFAGALR